VPNSNSDHPPARVEGHLWRISYVGHATLLIQTAGLNILTDPVWSERASPFDFVGPKRVNDPGVPFEALPPIDIVLLSHNHYDHLDLATLSRLAAAHRPRVITHSAMTASCGRTMPGYRARLTIGANASC
jgi:L-ascorbate metabolism protein UlaG (beta-lactamase superfamily)